jgi:hypothetical protein
LGSLADRVTQVIQAIPNALGALCLNQVGQNQLASRPTIIPGLFTVFTSERHLQVLQDKENAVLMGTAIDELIRHHPMLKNSVFQALKSTLSKIEDLGNAFVVPEQHKSWYCLVVEEPTQDLPAVQPLEDVLMTDMTMAEPNLAVEASTDDANGPSDKNGKDSSAASHDNSIVSFIDVLGRVNFTSHLLGEWLLTLRSRSFSRAYFNTSCTATSSSRPLMVLNALVVLLLSHAFRMTLRTAYRPILWCKLSERLQRPRRMLL